MYFPKCLLEEPQLGRGLRTTGLAGWVAVAAIGSWVSQSCSGRNEGPLSVPYQLLCEPPHWTGQHQRPPWASAPRYVLPSQDLSSSQSPGSLQRDCVFAPPSVAPGAPGSEVVPVSLGVEQPLHVAQEQFQSSGVTLGTDFC